MEFNEKLQQLRTGKNLTQEQLAEQLYVSRTAISKWESGKGYPNIESLKCISKFFSVTIDELLSGEELITLAETENRSNLKKIYSFIYGILDMMAVTFILLPLYGNLVDGYIYSVNLLSFTDTILMFLTVSPFVFVAMKTKGFVAPMIGSAVIVMGSAALSNQEWGALYPWTATYFLVQGKLQSTGYPTLLSVSIIILVSAVGFLMTFHHFKKEDLK